jgi:hypothetical protein
VRHDGEGRPGVARPDQDVAMMVIYILLHEGAALSGARKLASPLL